VHFNLAENRRDPDYPFAFMATYTSGLSADGVLRHLLLGQALREYAGIGDKAKLLQLLTPIQQRARPERRAIGLWLPD
jgi:non-specific serine/threonine protein kinase